MGLKLSPKSTKSHEKLFYGLSTGEDIEYRTNIHSCEKLKHHFFEVSFQKKMLFWCSFSSSCSTKALFSDSEVCWIFLIVFWGWHPDKWQFSKVERKKLGKTRFLRSDAVGNPEIHVQGASLAVIWISVRISRFRWKLPLLYTHKV